MKKIYSIPFIVAIAAIMMFGQSQGDFFGIKTAFGYGGGGGNTTPTPISGDINNDNKVDILDFSVMMAQWGQTGSGLSADFNQDGVVNILDFSLLMANWNQ